MAAPAKTPAAILDELNAELVRIITLPDVRERFSAQAFTIVGDNRTEFAALIKSETVRWGKAVRDSGANAH